MILNNKKILRYKNKCERRVKLIVEPWADEYWIDPGMVVDIVGSGGDPSEIFEIDHHKDVIVVFAWPGGMIHVLHDGEELPSWQ